jgi:histidyl-tRNA synthetase
MPETSIRLSTQARLPRGLNDLTASDAAATRAMLDVIAKVYASYGFEAMETPFLEYSDVLGKFLPDQERPNAGVFSFQDDDAQWMSLRYDLTAPLARFIAQNYEALPKPYRSHRAGYVFRNEKPGPGRFRQFMQCDADIVGSASVNADAELCMMMAAVLDELGLSGQYVIKVNHRKILDGVMETIGMGGQDNAARRLIIMRGIDKYDRLGASGVEDLLGAGRKDESGDFTKGAGLDSEQRGAILALLTGAAPAANPLAEQAKADLAQLERLCMSAGYGREKIAIDPSIVRGLEYYTGIVFEAEITFQTNNDKGEPVRFGSIGGGGRYDGLIGRFHADSPPATGFSIGVSRLLAALKTTQSPLIQSHHPDPLVVVTVMDKDRFGDYHVLAKTLRESGIRTDLYLGEAGFKAQMKYCDRRGAAIAIIQGQDEKVRGQVQIKDLRLGVELVASGKDRADYLEQQQRAQFAVPETDMVTAIRDVLNRY